MSFNKTKEVLSSRRDELEKKKAAIHAASGPLREKRDAYVNETREKIKAMDAEIKAVEKELYDTDQELGMLARAFGGRRMSDSVV